MVIRFLCLSSAMDTHHGFCLVYARGQTSALATVKSPDRDWVAVRCGKETKTARPCMLHLVIIC